MEIEIGTNINFFILYVVVCLFHSVAVSPKFVLVPSLHLSRSFLNVSPTVLMSSFKVSQVYMFVPCFLCYSYGFHDSSNVFMLVQKF